jgi:hypothetical protein
MPRLSYGTLDHLANVGAQFLCCTFVVEFGKVALRHMARVVHHRVIRVDDCQCGVNNVPQEEESFRALASVSVGETESFLDDVDNCGLNANRIDRRTLGGREMGTFYFSGGEK